MHLSPNSDSVKRRQQVRDRLKQRLEDRGRNGQPMTTAQNLSICEKEMIELMAQVSTFIRITPRPELFEASPQNCNGAGEEKVELTQTIKWSVMMEWLDEIFAHLFGFWEIKPGTYRPIRRKVPNNKSDNGHLESLQILQKRLAERVAHLPKDLLIKDPTRLGITPSMQQEEC